MKNFRKLLPFTLSALIVVLDQITKALVMKNIPLNSIKYSFFGDLIYICHVRNLGAAFSMGEGRSDFFRILVFIIHPIALMAFVFYLIVSEKAPLSRYQRWVCAGIAGGGIGTLIDRIFRFDSGVVDFVSVKFFGIFGLERWPTFNVSDSCVVVFVILFAISVLFPSKDRKEN